ncbi:MAG: response regulator [Pseudomonadota bacterium]
MKPAILKNILYVEDDSDIQEVARVALEAVGGFTLKVCSSGQEAIEAIKSDFIPDLILLDVMMPQMDGRATLTELRKLPVVCNTPVIFMTVKVQPYEVNEYLSQGALGVIAKPFDPLLLSEKILAHWNQYKT